MIKEEDYLSEDTVSQSGWVFADLLVALSVIFLATISFVPALSGGSAPVEVEPGKLAKAEGFSMIYETIDPPALIQDLERYRVESLLPSGVKVILLQFIGSANSENSRDGILDALEFSLKLKSDFPEFMENVNVSLDTSSKLDTGEVLVRAVFATERR